MILKPKTICRPIKGHWATKGLVGFWGMMPWEAGGNTVHNLSGNNFSGSITDATWVTGKYGPCLKFDGTNDRIDIPSLSSVWNGKNWSLSYWVSTTSVATAQWIMSGSVATGTADEVFRCAIVSSNFVFTNDYGVSITGPTPISGELYHYAVTFDYGAQIASLYINGILVGTDTSFSDPGANLALVRFGLPTWTTTSGLIGTFDLPLIFNRTLSAFEIALLYREPFCMFDYDPIELWSAATQGGAAAANNPWNYYAQCA